MCVCVLYQYKSTDTDTAAGAAKQITATKNSAKEIPPQDLLVVKSVSKSSLLGLHQLGLADCQAPKYEKTLWLQLQVSLSLSLSDSMCVCVCVCVWMCVCVRVCV